MTGFGIGGHFQKNLFQRPAARIDTYHLTSQIPDLFQGRTLGMRGNGEAYNSVAGDGSFELCYGDGANYNFSLLARLKKIGSSPQTSQPASMQHGNAITHQFHFGE